MDKSTGVRKVDKGPCQWFPGPYEQWEVGTSIWLSSTEYVIVQDKLSGERRVDKGPNQWFPGPYDEWEVGTSISLLATEYIDVLDKLTGRSSMVKGPTIWFPGPYDSPGPVEKAIVLLDDEFVKLKDIATGKRWIQRGKALVFLYPTWRVEESSGHQISKSLGLRGREYVRLHIAPHLRITKERGQQADAGPAVDSGAGVLVPEAGGLPATGGALSVPGAGGVLYADATHGAFMAGAVGASG